MMVEVLTVGEPLVVFAATNLDQTLATANQFTKFIAGAELNVAAGIARMGHSVDYLTAVGADPFGDFARQELQKLKIGNAGVTQNFQRPTGIMFKELVSSGDPQTLYYRSGSAASDFGADVVTEAVLNSVQFLHLTGVFAAVSPKAYQTVKRLMVTAKTNGATQVIFDPNLRPTLWADRATMIEKINELSLLADIVMPGLTEGQLLTGQTAVEDIAEFYFTHSQHVQTVLIKLGDHGAYVAQREAAGVHVPGFSVPQVVDTVGAGDGFAAGVITALLEGAPLSAAVVRGNAIGALAVQQQGDNAGYPTPAELTTFLEQNQND